MNTGKIESDHINLLEEADRQDRPTVTLASGHKVPKYILCKECGQKLAISPNAKGAFSYQGCDCNGTVWHRYES